MRLLWFAILCLVTPFASAWELTEENSAPSHWDGEGWMISPITNEDTEQFYLSYQDSAPYLYRVLGWGWPTQKISVEMNRDMVRHHVSQHEQKQSFTYVLRVRGERGIVGAIYVNPVNQERRDVPNFDARQFDGEVSFWLNQEAESNAAISTFVPDLMRWLETQWSFSQVLIPVHEEYEFMQEQFTAHELEPFTEDADAGMLLYRSF
ncbi:MAG: Acetyltransferase (GNAT) domain [Idiomarinaceae bacterium HL-53]|nr:MAG: Acetyltransferase (GNAT) domain [Idiomarinaceae bacterium HL-53]CUS48327.1 Acetyltransferase (GNAT) domain [Idiomarinaceae bacterium HL-53]